MKDPAEALGQNTRADEHNTREYVSEPMNVRCSRWPRCPSRCSTTAVLQSRHQIRSRNAPCRREPEKDHKWLL
jgi:hypothetical protein